MVFDSQSILQVSALACSRGERDLFARLDFTLAAGELMQVQGHNGCGKTSLLRILAGLAPTQSGEVSWCGTAIDEDPETYRAQLLYAGHQVGIKDTLTALENLQFARQLKNVNSQCRFETLAQLGLRGFEDISCRSLSAGQKRRVGLARLLLSDCQLWILDEPFTALDVKGVAVVEAMCANHLQQGGMIVLTSHQSLQSLQSRTVNLTDYALELMAS